MAASGSIFRLARRLRAYLPVCALALLICQIGLVATASAALVARATATVAADEPCTCDHTAGVMCPMHRRSSSRPVPANAPRWCAAGDTVAYLLVPVCGALAPPERVQHAPRPDAGDLVWAVVVGRTIRLDRPPDSPPPRV